MICSLMSVYCWELAGKTVRQHPIIARDVHQMDKGRPSFKKFDATTNTSALKARLTPTEYFTRYPYCELKHSVVFATTELPPLNCRLSQARIHRAWLHHTTDCMGSGSGGITCHIKVKNGCCDWLRKNPHINSSFFECRKFLLLSTTIILGTGLFRPIP